MRDKFSASVKQRLARRVGYKCSNPDCYRLTTGPHSNPRKIINIGVAAHIKAASTKGARYDASQTSAERKSIENGI